MRAQLQAEGLSLGRDKLFRTLKKHNLLVFPKKRYHKTTYSQHHYAVAPNRLKSTVVSRPNQAVASDITYIALARGFAYLFLVTDLFSRKILGFHLSRDLSHHSALLAFNMALERIPNPQGMLHHSDRGCQYCCHDYLRFLRHFGVESSMTDDCHCYQNAIAERVNGILKLELDLDQTFPTFEVARLAAQRAIDTYNNKRTHWSLALKTPTQVHSLAA